MSSSTEAILIKTAARWKIPRDLAVLVISRDLQCIYCSEEFQYSASMRRCLPSWEHIVNDLALVTNANIALCCVGCNASKGNRSLATWLESRYCKTHNVADRMAPVALAALVSSK